MASFKENLKEYMSTRDGAVANVASMAYGTVANESPMAKATNMMRRYIKDFTMILRPKYFYWRETQDIIPLPTSTIYI